MGLVVEQKTFHEFNNFCLFACFVFLTRLVVKQDLFLLTTMYTIQTVTFRIDIQLFLINHKISSQDDVKPLLRINDRLSLIVSNRKAPS